MLLELVVDPDVELELEGSTWLVGSVLAVEVPAPVLDPVASMDP